MKAINEQFKKLNAQLDDLQLPSSLNPLRDVCSRRKMNMIQIMKN